VESSVDHNHRHDHRHDDRRGDGWACVRRRHGERRAASSARLREPGDEALFERVSPQRSSGTKIVAVLFLVAAAVAAYIVFRVRAPEQKTAAPAPAAVQTTESIVQPLGGDAASIVLPPLDQSDSVVADLVRTLSSHPRVAAWLTTTGLIRNFAAVVLAIADGKTPAKLLTPLRPGAPFRVIERDGGIYIDNRSYDRYTPLAQAVSSIDAKGSASLYATLKPRIEEAYRELGHPDPSFDAALERAIVALLETPVRRSPPRLRPQGIGYAFADPHDGSTGGQEIRRFFVHKKNFLLIS